MCGPNISARTCSLISSRRNPGPAAAEDAAGREGCGGRPRPTPRLRGRAHLPPFPASRFPLPDSHFPLPPPASPSTQTHQQQHGAITWGLMTAGPQPASRRAGLSSLLGPELTLPFSVPPALCTQAALPALVPVDVAAVVPGLLHSHLTALSMEDPVATHGRPSGRSAVPVE